jgi:hypothetical protein
LKGKNIFYVEPEPEVALPIMLRKLREGRRLTQGDIAKVLEEGRKSKKTVKKTGL